MKWLCGSIAVLALVGCSANPGISSIPTVDSNPTTPQTPASTANPTEDSTASTNETPAATSNPLCDDEANDDGSASRVSSAGFARDAGEDRVMMTAPPTTNPEPDLEPSDVVLYANFIQRDPCPTGTQRSTIEVRYVLQGDVAVDDELEIVIDDETYRGGAIAADNTGPTDVFLFSLDSAVGGARRAKLVEPAIGGQLSLARLRIGVDRPGCSIGPPDQQARNDALASDPQPTIEPATVVVAADVLLDFGADSHSSPTMCANGAVPSQSALVVVRDSYKGDIAPGTVLTVTTFDTNITLWNHPGLSDDGATDVVLALTPNAELPGIGRADWAAVGIHAIDYGNAERQAAWKSIVQAAPSDSGSASGRAETCGGWAGDARSGAPMRELPRTGDIVVLASITTPAPCTTGEWTATIHVEWVGDGEVQVGDDLDVVIGSDTSVDDNLRSAGGDNGIPFVFVIDREGQDLVATTAVAAESNDLRYWNFDVDRPGCSSVSHPSIEAVATNPPSADTAGAADAVIVGRVLTQLGTVRYDPEVARCPNGAVQAHSALVEVRESLKGELAPGSVLLVTTFDTAGWLGAPLGLDDPDPIIALTKDELLPGVGTAEWAARGFDRIDDATPPRIAAWTEAIATAETMP